MCFVNNVFVFLLKIYTILCKLVHQIATGSDTFLLGRHLIPSLRQLLRLALDGELMHCMLIFVSDQPAAKM